MARTKVTTFNIKDLTHEEAIEKGLERLWLDVQEAHLKKWFGINSIDGIVDELLRRAK